MNHYDLTAPLVYLGFVSTGVSFWHPYGNVYIEHIGSGSGTHPWAAVDAKGEYLRTAQGHIRKFQTPEAAGRAALDMLRR